MEIQAFMDDKSISHIDVLYGFTCIPELALKSRRVINIEARRFLKDKISIENVLFFEYEEIKEKQP